MIEEGTQAPDFTLRDKDDVAYTLSEVDTDYTVLFFYPKDNTPGCTTESKGFSDLLPEFEKVSATVFGISGGDNKTKAKFCEKHGLGVTLLSDTDFKVAESFDCYGEKKFMGRTFLGLHRQTVVLDRDKKVVKAYQKVKTGPHPQEVLEFLQEL